MRRAIALTVSIVATIFFGLTAAGSLSEQTFGLTTVPAATSCALVVTGVSRGGSSTGLAAGDTIDASRLTAHERLRLMVPRSTDHMMLAAHPKSAAGAMAMVMATPAAPPSMDAAYGRIGVLLVLMSLGLYVLWRGRDAASLGLGIFFALMPAFFLSHAYAGLPDAAIVAVLFLAAFLNVFGYFGLYLMVDALASPALPTGVRRASQAGAIGALTLAAFTLFSSIYGRVFTGCPPLLNVQIVLACYATVIALCFILLWRGISDPQRRIERGRLRWVFWSTVAGFTGPLIGFAFIALGLPAPLMGLLNLTFLAIPLGYSYAVLRHRVIDVGFVVNRALSLTILTTAIVALFGIVESVLEHLTVGHAESMLVQIVVSLGLGMAFGKAHAWLEARLERVLFRRRYELEEALRELGERASSETDEDALLRDVAETLARTLALAGSGVYRFVDGRYLLAASAGAEAAATEVSAALLSLELGVGGKNYGGIVLVEDPSVEAFATEELSLLRLLAIQLSAAIAALRAEKYEQLLAR